MGLVIRWISPLCLQLAAKCTGTVTFLQSFWSTARLSIWTLTEPETVPPVATWPGVRV